MRQRNPNLAYETLVNRDLWMFTHDGAHPQIPVELSNHVSWMIGAARARGAQPHECCQEVAATLERHAAHETRRRHPLRRLLDYCTGSGLAAPDSPTKDNAMNNATLYSLIFALPSVTGYLVVQCPKYAVVFTVVGMLATAFLRSPMAPAPEKKP